MKKFIFSLCLFLAISNVKAADSLWLLCENGVLAVNSIEHRAAGGLDRQTTLQLLIGANTFKGVLKNQDEGQVSLKGSQTTSRYNGYIAIDYSKLQLTLKGELILYKTIYQVNTKLNCKEMDFNL